MKQIIRDFQAGCSAISWDTEDGKALFGRNFDLNRMADITKITKIQNRCGNDLTVWSGNDDMTVPMMSLGAKGVISVLSNVVPLETQTMCRAALAGDFDTAAALQLELQPLVEALFCEVNPIPVKEAMKMIGYDCGACRLPLGAMSAENRKKLEKILCE